MGNRLYYEEINALNARCNAQLKLITDASEAELKRMDGEIAECNKQFNQIQKELDEIRFFLFHWQKEWNERKVKRDMILKEIRDRRTNV